MKLLLKVENMEQEESWQTYSPLSDHRTSSTMTEPVVYFSRSSASTSIMVSPSGSFISTENKRETQGSPAPQERKNKKETA